MAQNNFVEIKRRKQGREFNHLRTLAQRRTRATVLQKVLPQKLTGMRAKLLDRSNRKNKIELQKRVQQQRRKSVDQTANNANPVPSFLLNKGVVAPAKAISSAIKQRSRALAQKSAMPLPKVAPLSDAEVLKALRTGKKRKPSWKRVVRKSTFVGQDFTRKPPKLERYVRPSALRVKKAHVSHPLLKITAHLNILAVKTNPQSKLFTGLGVVTKGAVLEVDTAPLGLVTTGGKVVWSKYAQVTNKPELDGCVNAVLLI